MLRLSGLVARRGRGQVLFLIAAVPLILGSAAIALLVAAQSRHLAEREIGTLENQMMAAKRVELRNYLSIARSAIFNVYGRAAPDDEAAKLRVSQTLAALLYGKDGYFFVYDYDGNNLVSPRDTRLIGRNWADMTDAEGTPVTDTLIRLARSGGGYHSYMWRRPSTGKQERMIAYVIGLQDWRWAIGTGVFVDDVLATAQAARAGVQARVRRTFLYIGTITLGALLLVFGTGVVLNLRERRLNAAQVKTLTQRVFDTQEEERSRVARELHDGISQILVGVRYALDTARRRLAAGDKRGMDHLDRGIGHLSGAIQEVRRISRYLRPGALDDLGLGPALKALAEDFGQRTGIETDFTTVVFRNRLDEEAKIALYRVAQEALTNIERHSGASRVSMDVRGHARGATLRIADNGCGLSAGSADAAAQARPEVSPRQGQTQGLGLRNMQERMEQLGGHVKLSAGPDGAGTVVEATVPLSHLLLPQENNETVMRAPA